MVFWKRIWGTEINFMFWIFECILHLKKIFVSNVKKRFMLCTTLPHNNNPLQFLPIQSLCVHLYRNLWCTLLPVFLLSCTISKFCNFKILWWTARSFVELVHFNTKFESAPFTKIYGLGYYNVEIYSGSNSGFFFLGGQTFIT